MMVSFFLLFYFKKWVIVDACFLEEFAFYVNKNGSRSRKDFMVHWEGTPTGFGTLITPTFFAVPQQ